MTKRRYLMVVACIGLVIGLIGFFAPLTAKECRMIMLQGGSARFGDAIYIDPETTFVDKDACVVWINNVRTAEIKIKFVEGKKCSDMTQAPVGFKLDEANCFVTSWVPYGGTSSLNFMESGVYEYTVEINKGVTKQGRIVVK
jgi:hypothetical protein